MSKIAREIALKDFEGYIQVTQNKENKMIMLENFKNENIEQIEKYMDDKNIDIYFTVNTSFNGKRGGKNLKQLRAFYLDFDFHEENLSKNELMNKINDIIAEVWMAAFWGKAPRPTRAVFTGRGVQIYWDIKPSSYGALVSWQEFEDYLYNQFKYLGADRQATDCSRLMRLWGTVNSKSKTKCELMILEKENVYSLYDLRETYLGWNERHKKSYVKKESNKNASNKKINLYNSYTLHLARARDIVKLVKIRKGNVTGYRNFILHCYAYWEGIYNRDTEVLKEMVYELNNSFTEPLKNTEVNAILRCIPKAIESFLKFQEEVGKGNIKVTKNMRNKGGYWYKNITLIERLDITAKEQEQLETIIDKKEKYKRNNKNRVENRKNKDGLTKREQQKQDTIKAIKSLKTQGFKQVEVAKKLGKGLRTIERYWNI
ncbi:MAG: DNA-binding response regulator [Clostridium sp.]|uniref:DNA-binding response regulator n=1 Tax=Clostridium sp. TaxID=1506 RepID=UPI003EE6B00C